MKPALYGLFRVLCTQTFKPYKARAARRPDGCMLYIGAAFYAVATIFQIDEYRLKSKAVGNGCIKILPHKAADGGFSALLGFPLGIVLAVAFAFNDR